MGKAIKLAENLLFGLNVLIIFVLFAEQWLTIPSWLQVAGRLHPALVHFPIVIILLAVALYLYDVYTAKPSLNAKNLLLAGAVSASLAIVTGFFLSKEGGYDPSVLSWHKWTGLGVSLMSTGLYYFMGNTFRKGLLPKTLAVMTILIVGLAGHFGGSLTHGEDFILGPMEKFATRSPGDSSLFAQAIQPMMENKCYGCHNPGKSKGRLILTSFENMLKGGKDGPLWTRWNPDKSLLMERLRLPLEAKHHMPPKDKSQLEKDDIQLIERWIASGADAKVKLTEVPEDDPLKKLGSVISVRYVPVVEPAVLYHFAFASNDKIEKLNTPYRAVFQLARNEPALCADFFIRKSFQRKYLEELGDVKEQLVSLNLSNMPVADADLSILRQFNNLERLNLNYTNITEQGLATLQRLPRLQSLSLSGTHVTIESLNALTSIGTLRRVFLWNAGIAEEDARKLGEKFPLVDWQTGYVLDKKEILQLSAPLLQNENQVLSEGEEVTLKATLPGTIIRYTMDGTLPDSVNGSVFEKPISCNTYAVIRARAFKDGWKSSEVAEYIFFKKGYPPDRVQISYPADEKYPGLGAATLVDGEKGIPEFFKGGWIAFRNKPLEAFFYFDRPPTLHSLTISFSKNVDMMTMPPATVEVWGGNSATHLKLLNKIIPSQPTGYGGNRIEGLLIPLSGTSYACYKLIATPLPKLPAFRKAGKNDKGWLMVDEVFFN